VCVAQWFVRFGGVNLYDQSHEFLRQCWLEWLGEQTDSAVADVFGYHAIQLGMPELDGLRANRMPHQWLADVDSYGADWRSLSAAEPGHAPRPIDVDCDSHALPFESSSLDLVLMPHTLERAGAPHETLREVARVLMPEGHVVIAGLNPFSLWALRQRRFDWAQRLGIQRGVQASPFDVAAKHWIGVWRLRDWLKLLGFEVRMVNMGMYRPGVASTKWAQRWSGLDAWGHKLWPVAGSVYVLVAVKRVRGMRLMGPPWVRKRVRGRAAVKQPASAMNREQD
jgi:SAM-dependent methyltransferase